MSLLLGFKVSVLGLKGSKVLRTQPRFSAAMAAFWVFTVAYAGYLDPCPDASKPFGKKHERWSEFGSINISNADPKAFNLQIFKP